MDLVLNTHFGSDHNCISAVAALDDPKLVYQVGSGGVEVWGKMFEAPERVNGFLRSLKALKVPNCWKAEEE